jgi:hypothetical protein
MVFQRVLTLYGTKVDVDGLLGHFRKSKRKTIQKLIQLYDTEDDADGKEDILLDFMSLDDISIFTPPCCSKNYLKTFVIGEKVDHIDRLVSNCDKCEDPYTCDQCLSLSVRHFFKIKIDKFFDDFYEVPDKFVCKKCLNVAQEETDVCPQCHWQLLVSNKISDRMSFSEGKRFYQILDDCVSCT